ncbi:FAD-dependent monooxygenase [Nocardia sp. NPDC050175]|uniref:FAD-dependent monooxygenase n=1 Tax=Nocardia sp. NPDC050175 TaxID=3364317 RepID=UPI0037A8C4B0
MTDAILPPALDADILIVGAGPVGMTLACELSAAGIDVDIIARTRRASPHSRATIIWPRVLELLDRVGLADPLIARGHYFDQMNYYSEKSRIGLIRFDRLPDVQYPFAITCPQWKIEEVIEQRLNTLGTAVHYDREFVSGCHCESHVECTVKDVDGTTHTKRYQWVVGADGYHSTVRDIFGFQFAGRALTTRLAITDAEIIGETTSSEAAYYLTRGGNMVLAPLGDGIFRVGTTVPDDYTGSEQPSREFFEHLLAQRVPGNRKLGHMRFSGIFNANIRSANAYGNGRVLLVGDAAHAMSPSGAQGLNTGLQDASNLGWKLAGVIKGRYPRRLIDTYDRERRPAVAEVSKLSTTLARIGLYESPVKIALRDLAYRVGSTTGLLERYVAPQLAQTTTTHGPPAKFGVLTAGRRLPLSWRTVAAEPMLDRERYSIILWPGNTYDWTSWREFSGDITRRNPDAAVIDLAGRPPGRLGPLLPDKAVALICRPDGHLERVLQLDTSADHRAKTRNSITLAMRGLLATPTT